MDLVSVTNLRLASIVLLSRENLNALGMSEKEKEGERDF